MAYRVLSLFLALLLFNSALTQDFGYWEECPVSIRHRHHLRVRGSYCYYFINFTKQSFEMSEKGCEKHGGSLVKITSPSLNSFLRHTMYQDFKVQDENVWIGLSDQLFENRLLWEYDLSVPTYTNFDSTRLHPIHGCIVMNTLTGKWSSKKCDSVFEFMGGLNYFICQYKIKTTTTTQAPTTPTTATPSPTPAATTVAPAANTTSTQPPL